MALTRRRLRPNRIIAEEINDGYTFVNQPVGANTLTRVVEGVLEADRASSAAEGNSQGAVDSADRAVRIAQSAQDNSVIADGTSRKALKISQGAFSVADAALFQAQDVVRRALVDREFDGAMGPPGPSVGAGMHAVRILVNSNTPDDPNNMWEPATDDLDESGNPVGWVCQAKLLIRNNPHYACYFLFQILLAKLEAQVQFRLG